MIKHQAEVKWHLDVGNRAGRQRFNEHIDQLLASGDREHTLIGLNVKLYFSRHKKPPRFELTDTSLCLSHGKRED